MKAELPWWGDKSARLERRLVHEIRDGFLVVQGRGPRIVVEANWVGDQSLPSLPGGLDAQLANPIQLLVRGGTGVRPRQWYAVLPFRGRWGRGSDPSWHEVDSLLTVDEQNLGRALLRLGVGLRRLSTAEIGSLLGHGMEPGLERSRVTHLIPGRKGGEADGSGQATPLALPRLAISHAKEWDSLLLRPAQQDLPERHFRVIRVAKVPGRLPVNWLGELLEESKWTFDLSVHFRGDGRSLGLYLMVQSTSVVELNRDVEALSAHLSRLGMGVAVPQQLDGYLSVLPLAANVLGDWRSVSRPLLESAVTRWPSGSTTRSAGSTRDLGQDSDAGGRRSRSRRTG